MSSEQQQQEPSKPRVSVVIAVHNAAKALRRALAALDASSGRESFEVLVVDAGSTDGGGGVDVDFPSVTVLRLPRNFGKTRARNIGTRTAQAELVFYLDPNVEVAPATVERLAGLLESRDDATAVAPGLKGDDGARVDTAFRLPSAGELADAALSGEPLRRVKAEGPVEAVDEAALMVRKSFIAGMNYLDERRFSEHWSLLEVCWQIRNAGKKLLLEAEPSDTLHAAAPAVRDENLYTADRVAGAAAYVAKHEGFGAGIAFRIKCFFRALGGFRLSLAWSIVLGERIDPTQ